MEWEETCDEDTTLIQLHICFPKLIQQKLQLVLKYGFLCVVLGVGESIKNHGTP